MQISSADSSASGTTPAPYSDSAADLSSSAQSDSASRMQRITVVARTREPCRASSRAALA